MLQSILDAISIEHVTKHINSSFLSHWAGSFFKIIQKVELLEVMMSLVVRFLVVGFLVVCGLVVRFLVVGRLVVVGVMSGTTEDFTERVGGSVFSSMLQSILDAISIEHVTKHINSSFLSHWAGSFFKIIQKVEFLEV